jgi:GT2 family glycosyltransferase
VSLVVVNHDGANHLRSCLDSVAELDYPSDRLETVVVDNASSDESLTMLRQEYAWARVLALPKNVGFAAGVNAGAEGATGDCLALCNNDMRLEQSWLQELVAAYDPDGGARCIAGVILDWDGAHIDFAGGWVNFHGAAGQEHFGRPVEEVPLEDGREIPFACGGAMLVDRRRFLELGGFDPTFFALVEDVDFGWRSWLAGDRVRLAARARSLHRHSATTSRLGAQRLAFLSERNALRMLIKNLDDANVAPVLAAALFLLAERAALDPSGAGHAPLQATTAVTAELDDLLERRLDVQRLRVRTDPEVFRVFGSPLIAVGGDATYLETAARVTRMFGLDQLFAGRDQTLPFHGREPAPTEPLGQLLARWRLEYGIGKSPVWHLRHAVWRGLPESLRRRAAPLFRRRYPPARTRS